MDEVERALDAVFFRTEQGNEPVREWLRSLAKSERKVIGGDVLKVQHCWPIGKPLVGSLGHGLWEVRSRLGDRIARVIFCVEGRTMVLLHGFVKKTQPNSLLKKGDWLRAARSILRVFRESEVPVPLFTTGC